MGKAAVLCAFLCLLALPARADLAAGRQAFDAGDYASAEGELRPLAEEGNAEAAFLLARMTEHGWGVPASDVEAWHYYKRAANAGHGDALVSAADFADLGRGTPADHRLAYDLYKRAAEAGNARARGRIGEMALDGRGRKVNAAEALSWLRQAAAEDDPEALFLLDRLAASHRTTALPAGTSSPAEAPARRLLEEVRGVLAGMAGLLVPNGEPTAVTRPDGSVMVTVPDVSAPGDAATYRLGTIRLVFRDIAADSAKVTLLLPSQILATDGAGGPAGSLRISGQRAWGTWSLALHGFTDWRAEAVAAIFDLPNSAGVTLQGLSYERRLAEPSGSRLTVMETATAANAGMHFSLGGQVMAMAARRLAWRAEMRDFDFGAYRRWTDSARLDWRLASVALHMLTGGGIPLPTLSANGSGSLSLEGASYDVDGQTVLAAQRLETALALAELDRPLAAAHLSYAYQGLHAPQARYLPSSLDGSLACESLPAGRGWALLRGAVARTVEVVLGSGRDPRRPGVGEALGSTVTDDLVAALSAAGTRVHLQDVAATGPGWDATAHGRVLPDNGGVTVALDAAVRGLDAFLLAGNDLGRSAVQTLRDSAGAGVDEKGRPTSLFQLALPSGGKALVNGRPLTLDGW